MQLSKLYAKEPHAVFRGHTPVPPMGQEARVPILSGPPPFVEPPSSAFSPHSLFTSSPVFPHHPEFVQNCSFCSALAPPLMLTLFLAPKGSCPPCRHNAPLSVVGIVRFDVSKVIHSHQDLNNRFEGTLGVGHLHFPGSYHHE